MNTDILLQTEHDSVTVTPQKQNEQAQRDKNEAARRLLQEWLADETGYDEEVWPQVKQLLEDNRLSMRSRFSD
jgi:uncharacterized lipoprotein